MVKTELQKGAFAYWAARKPLILLSHTHKHTHTHSQMWFSCCSGDRVWWHLINQKSWSQTRGCKLRNIEHSLTAGRRGLAQRTSFSQVFSLHPAEDALSRTPNHDLWTLQRIKNQLHGSVAPQRVTRHLLGHFSPKDEALQVWIALLQQKPLTCRTCDILIKLAGKLCWCCSSQCAERFNSQLQLNTNCMRVCSHANILGMHDDCF